MLERSGSSLKVTAPMYFSGAAQLLKAGRAALTDEISEIDLSSIEDADSAALAVLFAWLREAKARNISLRIVNPPAGLLSLAALYGVDEFLPLA
ncbi:MAG: phospholipid transport system transporter-binding protein [Pseudomonadota bacterium]|jgi:phospholipid transport system transporter-binding protein|nr:phospholipid transport system transporter-binding protein [Pseudomonadota bacterium]MDQ5916389.1 phospholipid transport system transporter-binding protein [Pseudomonadota bacterium]MDQ5918470.1 phospholipid transport system transporter-binding protein [Pseudomonadota bacterium]MDQ5946031.1 phospholipid transport system transporter-binding protein [Pseudomonadota bacterium]